MSSVIYHNPSSKPPSSEAFMNYNGGSKPAISTYSRRYPMQSNSKLLAVSSTTSSSNLNYQPLGNTNNNNNMNVNNNTNSIKTVIKQPRVPNSRDGGGVNYMASTTILNNTTSVSMVNPQGFFIPKPPSSQKSSVSSSPRKPSLSNNGSSSNILNASNVAPRRYNMEKLKLYVLLFDLFPNRFMSLTHPFREKFHATVNEFTGFGSGVPDTIQSARGPSSINKVSSQVKQPLTARVSQRTMRKTPPMTQSDNIETKQWRFPDTITPAMAIKNYSPQLTDYEQSEIFDYPRIYCIGNTKNKIKGSVSGSKCNHGYDDQRGDYQIILNDHVAYRYEVISLLGKGSFGQVCKCLDVKTNKYIALKMIRNKERFHHQALVEVDILKHLRDHDPEKHHHIIEMYNSFYFRGHLCITFELLSINLYEFIKNNNFQGLSLGLIRRFAVQILNSLKYLYHEQIIHCDLKPENILLKSPNKSAIKMIDFGSSCFVENRMFTYIQSRFYRSPEVILGIPYGRGIDMWSFGCILAELYMGYPIFPGENEIDQMNYIMEIFDVPPRRVIEMSTRKKHFFDSYGNPRLVVCRRSQKKRKPGSKDLACILRCRDQHFVNFLEGCLKWDPSDRFTPEDALRHEWILESLVASNTTIPRDPTQYAMSILPNATDNYNEHQNGHNGEKKQKTSVDDHYLPPIEKPKSSAVVNQFSLPTSVASNPSSLAST